VAATTEEIAAEACKLIEVDYEVLPWSIEIEDAIKPDAPVLHEFNKWEGKPSNIAGRLEHKKGDIAEGFKQADVVIERTFTTRPVHQGYIEPHACLISVAPDGKTTMTVNLALVSDGRPLLGFVGAPALGLVWRGLVGRGAERVTLDGTKIKSIEAIRTRPCPALGKPWTVAVSRSHGNAATEGFIAKRPGAVRAELGSAVKFARVAEGAVDIYPRLGPTSEWDVAAGHAVVTAAGGKVTDSTGAELHFGLKREDFIVPEFIAWGDPAAAD